MRPFHPVSWILVGTACLFTGAVRGDTPWRTVKSDHFLVVHVGEKDFAQAVAVRAERYYDTIAGDLGFRRHRGFWLWDKRVSIRIYPTKRAFQAASKAPRWATGKASYERREIVTFQWSSGFLDSLLPHEITHLVLREWIGERGALPLWIHEGLAQWMEEVERGSPRRAAKQLLASGRAVPLRNMREPKLHDQPDAKAVTFYTQSWSVVAFLIETYGRERFGKLCRQLRAGKSMDDALRFTYPQSLRTIEELQTRWISYGEAEP
ncbi:MAG: hypothetical protein HQ559_08685 [Lentisphaerae bacterium]|nr:hypothetical protein [Lentisphaerota bacterium]